MEREKGKSGKRGIESESPFRSLKFEEDLRSGFRQMERQRNRTQTW